MSKTLYDLQVGDYVVVRGNYFEAIKSVIRVTNNYVIVDGIKYRKSDGLSVNSNQWTQKGIRIATQNDVDNIKKRQLHSQLAKVVSSVSFNSLSIEQLQSILLIINQDKS